MAGSRPRIRAARVLPERFAVATPLPPDLRPLRLRERLGQDDEGVDGQYLATQLAEPREVSLPGEHDRPGAYLPTGRREPRVVPRLVADDGAALEDLAPEALDGPGQAPDEPPRMHGGAVRAVERASGPL